MEKETYCTPEITSEAVMPGGLAVIDGSPESDGFLNALGGLALFSGSPQLNGPQFDSDYKPPQ